LEIAGYFITHGGLSALVEARGDKLYIDPHYSDVTDRIYEARKGGPPVEYAPTEPSFGDMREMLAKAMAEDDGDEPVAPTAQGRVKQGRNELCLCGSGKKYKRCCGRR
jgi:hypothetical protein